MLIPRFHLLGGCLAAVSLGLAVIGCGAGSPDTPVPQAIVTDEPATRPTNEALILTPDEPAALPTVPATLEASGPIAAGIIREYVDAGYRVIAVARNPFAPYTLIVASERSRSLCGSLEEPVRCRIDDACGATNTSPICYFFIEPSFPGATDPSTRFVARWPDSPGDYALDTESLRFIDGRTVEFVARGVANGPASEEIWWLDLVTGAVAQQNRGDG